MVADAYNNIAPVWHEERKNSLVGMPIVDFAEKLLAGGRILDIGCGAGVPLTKYLADRGFRVTGIDIAGKMIDIARSQDIPNAVFLQQDFLTFAGDEQFDGILAWDSLWHLPKEHQAAIYPKLSTLLRAGGCLLFTHGKEDSEKTGRMMGESFYYSALSKEQLTIRLSESGFLADYFLENYIEHNDHRDLVVLARKTNDGPVTNTPVNP